MWRQLRFRWYRWRYTPPACRFCGETHRTRLAIVDGTVHDPVYACVACQHVC